MVCNNTDSEATHDISESSAMVQVTLPTRKRQARMSQSSAPAWLTVYGLLVCIGCVVVVGVALLLTSRIRPVALSTLRVPTKPHRTAPHDWPPLRDVYDGRKVIADPQYLLDFAVIGFEKCGTSTLMKWLGTHPQVQMFQEEIYDIQRNRTGSLVWRLHTQLQPGFQYRRGYKSPIDIFSASALHLLDDYFPKTRLIIALRHPILYFESLYNFRIQNLPGANDSFILPLQGIGMCRADAQGVCTDHANFAEYMYRMGKTLSRFPTVSDQEIAQANRISAGRTRVTRNLVFVVEMTQFTDSDRTRKDQLKADLTAFLGLEGGLQDFPVAKPGKQWSEEVQAIKESRKMNICDHDYVPLRRELMRVARLTATWMRESFLHSDDVYFSSPGFFDEAMMKWMDDPCEHGYKGYQAKIIA